MVIITMTQPSPFEVGDVVTLSTPLISGPFRITRVDGNVMEAVALSWWARLIYRVRAWLRRS